MEAPLSEAIQLQCLAVPPLVDNPGPKSSCHPLNSQQMRNSVAIVPFDSGGHHGPNSQSINIQTVCAQMQPLMAEGALPVIPYIEQITIVVSAAPL